MIIGGGILKYTAAFFFEVLMEHKRFKYTLIFGLVVGIVLFLTSPVFAYDTFDIDTQPVGYTPTSAAWTYYYSTTDDYVSGYNHAFL